MYLNRPLLLALTSSCLLSVCGVTESALPFGVFPLLTSGWYYKPNPVESVIFGLIVVKILAIRLASVTGILPIPYHLNDLFVRSLGKRSIPEGFSVGSTNLTMPLVQGNLTKLIPKLEHKMLMNQTEELLKSKAPLSTDELKTIYRLLLSVRRLDTSDCFLKTLCFLGFESGKLEQFSTENYQLLETIIHLTSLEETERRSQDKVGKPSVMQAFYTAIIFGMDSETSNPCDIEYRACGLSEAEMNYESVLSDFS